MDTNKKISAGVVVALAVGVGTALAVSGVFANKDEAAARSAVMGFGAQLQKVSLLSPEASSTMASAYGEYVDRALLASWQKDPEKAPGRITSSPWPERIVIDETHQQGAGYIVRGRIILVTSQEAGTNANAGETPIIIDVVPKDGKWVIAVFQEVASSSLTK